MNNIQNTIIRKSQDRGYFNHGWLKSYHTFSFADYYDMRFMGFRDLRVINDDVIKPNTGFDLHPHKNMEIITYVLSGTLTHSDNLGHKEEIKEGCFQVMSAGSGIIHSEWNHGNDECHLLQIWIKPNQIGGKAYYKIYNPDHFEKWVLVASHDDSQHSIQIKQDAEVYAINSGSLQVINLPETNKDFMWLHVANGNIVIDDINLKSGDAIGLSNIKNTQEIQFLESSSILLFYLV